MADGLKDFAGVLGASLLGGAGPSGRQAATSFLNNRMALAESIRQQDMEIMQATAERKRDAAKGWLKIAEGIYSDPEALGKIPPPDLEKINNIAVEAARSLDMPNPEMIPEAFKYQASKKAESGFTLGQGQKRFDAQGNLVAEVAPKPREPSDNVNPFITWMNPNDKSQWKTTRRDSPEADRLAADGWLETDFKADAGDVSQGTADKRKTEFAKTRENQTFLEKRIDRAIELAQKPGAMRGTVGAIAGIAESISDQFAQVSGKRAFTGSKVDPEFISESASPTTRAALINGSLDPNLITIAFMIAQVNNPDGKISDADVKAGQDTINGDQGSIPVLIRGLEEVRRMGRDRVAAQEQTLVQDGIISGETATPEKSYVRGADGVWRLSK